LRKCIGADADRGFESLVFELELLQLNRSLFPIFVDAQRKVLEFHIGRDQIEQAGQDAIGFARVIFFVRGCFNL
jgi:hypothetical protein